MERFSIMVIQFINLNSCLNDLLTLSCLIIHNKIHKLIKIRKYFHGIWIECPKIRWYSIPRGLFFCINLLHCLRYSLLYSLDRFNFFLFPFFLLKFFLGGRYFPHHNFLEHFLIHIKLCILLFFVLIFTRQSFFSNLLVFSLIIF